MAKKLSDVYREILEDHFPLNMEIRFYTDQNEVQSLHYRKVEWTIGGQTKGLRYGENPDQEAALYQLCKGTLKLGDLETLQPGLPLASLPELIQTGKHPGKINITDVDSGLNILRFLNDTPAAVIIKHNNPCGVAKAPSLLQAYTKAFLADRLAAFGGAIVVNRPMDKETASAIAGQYAEVVAAPDFEPGVLDIFSAHKNLRVLKIKNIDHLNDFASERVLEFKSMMDGGIVVQTSFLPLAREPHQLLPAASTWKGVQYSVKREPTGSELDDMLFGWMVEAGVTSNSVLYVKDGVTVGIGTGEQDRVGVAEIARDKAYRKLADRISHERFQVPYALLSDQESRRDIWSQVDAERGGIKGSVMISDAFFPFRDGIEVGLREGVTAVLQPGGSLRDFESIEACNEFNAAMKFTGQRSFRH